MSWESANGLCLGSTGSWVPPFCPSSGFFLHLEFLQVVVSCPTYLSGACPMGHFSYELNFETEIVNHLEIILPNSADAENVRVYQARSVMICATDSIGTWVVGTRGNYRCYL